jgi:DNA-binding transcriptional LysR family regulator
LQRALRAHHPSLALELLDAVKEEDVVARLDAGEAELGIAVLPVPPRFVVHELGSDPYVAVVPATSRFASRSKISLAQLTDHPLLGVRGSHEAVVAARLAAAGIDCHAVTRYDDSRLIQAHVAAGNGIAIVPSTTVEAADPSIRVLGIHGNLPPRMLALVQLRDTLPAASAREFQQIALPLCRKLLVEVGACWADANAS